MGQAAFLYFLEGLQRRVGRKWWVGFSKDDGYVHTLFANRGGKVPGTDLSRILRSSARSDRATQVLLRDYADRRLRAFVDELGLDRSLSDLTFSDFRSEPGTTVPNAQAGAASVVVKSENLPAVFHIDLTEVIDKVPVEDAGITVTVDASNALLSPDARRPHALMARDGHVMGFQPLESR